METIHMERREEKKMHTLTYISPEASKEKGQRVKRNVPNASEMKFVLFVKKSADIFFPETPQFFFERTAVTFY